jgi:hypothetical protein
LSLTPKPMVRFVATEDRLGPPMTLTAPVMIRRVKLTGCWPPSLTPAPLTRVFKMLEVIEPVNAEEERVKPLPPLIDKVRRGVPGGTTLPKGKVSVVELTEMLELQEGTELAKTPKLIEVEELAEMLKLDKGGVPAETPKFNKGSKLARMPELNKWSKLARMPKLGKGSKLTRMPELNKGSKLARTSDLDKERELARTRELDKGGELAETPELLWVFAFAAVVWLRCFHRDCR